LVPVLAWTHRPGRATADPGDDPGIWGAAVVLIALLAGDGFRGRPAGLVAPAVSLAIIGAWATWDRWRSPLRAALSARVPTPSRAVAFGVPAATASAVGAMAVAARTVGLDHDLTRAGAVVLAGAVTVTIGALVLVVAATVRQGRRPMPAPRPGP
jgi:hypothetical protein